MPRHVDRFLQFSLVIGTSAGHSPGHDLPPLRNKMLEKFRILVIDCNIRILAESADPFPYIYPFFL